MAVPDKRSDTRGANGSRLPELWKAPLGSARGRVAVIAGAVVLALAASATIGFAVSRHPGPDTSNVAAGSPETASAAPPSTAPGGLSGTFTLPSYWPSPSPSTGATSSAPAPAATARPTSGPTGGPAVTKPAQPGSSVPTPIGSWALGDGSGTTALDSVGHHNGVAANITWVGGAAEFNGTDSEITVPYPVVDTSPGKSFTVAAWVCLRSADGFVTAVSQDGSDFSGFFLEYSGSDNRWAFARQSLDAADTVPHRALSTAPPALNTWTPLVGVFNGATDVLQLYVNGQLQGTAVDPTPFKASGNLVFGRSFAGGGQSAWFPGLIDHVKVFNQALTGAQISALGYQ
ncbi:MAG TPA: LamG domain-containing protein [Actinocrinis sp.]|nr:LamG domain-containing protein [Actinocrinis sp.]